MNHAQFSAESAKKQKKRKSSGGPSVGDLQVAGDFQIKPAEAAAQLDTSDWPLLLKNFDKLNVRTPRYTPIPSGCSPLHRSYDDYVR